MHIDISTQHTELTPSLKNYIQEKFQKLEDHASFNSKNELRLQLSLVVDDKSRHRVEGVLFGDKFANKNVLNASATTDDMYLSLNKVVKHLDRQMRKQKTAKISQRDQTVPVKRMAF